MGKAALDHTPDTAQEQPPLDDDAHWLSIKIAHQRLAERTSDNELAVIDLTELLAQGRLPCMVRSTVTGECKRIAATAWVDQLQIGPTTPDGVRVIHREPLYRVKRSLDRVKSYSIVNPVRAAHFYVWQPALDRIWPTANAPVHDEHDDDSNAPLRVKPGPKWREDWPILLAQWLIAVAVENPKRLDNVDQLLIDAQDQIKWTPSDPKVLRAKMVELLRGVRL